MIRPIEQLDHGRPFIDLTGADGNAFHILGYAKNLCKQLEWEYRPIADEMKAGDYQHLVATFEKHFGEFVDIYTDDPDLGRQKEKK